MWYGGLVLFVCVNRILLIVFEVIMFWGKFGDFIRDVGVFLLFKIILFMGFVVIVFFGLERVLFWKLLKVFVIGK